ncbi:RES family NAD+ phosphorylase [Sphingomonas sp. CGMCC 1.13654]|uniref:RES family NAD+ phosphorylase n=1 Tax=Sphingomonas chungangi TaxID=2683589 RepID=A0A838L0D5_9SPHN|nr:RES family NAD+ phosphorylase [Sphingomonas chungangi]MBA2932674.1 RES family NAD+ phosphorylase [Sphingomonas chungangi]MVW56297.1 RES domain-containing protein [Sphingomonas chungangi]
MASEPVPTAADVRPYAGKVWRIVEAQHRISTNRLADDAADQRLLEDLAEEAKPSLPLAARGLDYLLSTPFRYGYAKASRFRRAYERPGIFYASEHAATAVAEAAYWRLLFFSRSPGTQLPRGTIEHSAYTVRLRVERALDLTTPPLDTGRALWTDPADYAACQQLAGEARAIGAQLIRYASVRDAVHRVNVALLDPAGFADAAPKVVTTYHMRLDRRGIDILAAFPSTERHRFAFADFGLAAPA